MTKEKEQNEKLLKDLLKQIAETTTLDFKRQIKLSSDNDKEEFAKDVSAFANTKGGHIVFGKEDPKEGGRIVGIRPETFNSEQMQQIIAKRCYPPVRFDAKPVQLDSKWFILLTVPESSLKPHEIVETRVVYVRRGNTTDRATTREITQMDEERKRRPDLEEVQLSEETSIKAFEERAKSVTFGLIYVLCYLPVRLWAFWALGKGLGLYDWLRFETLAYPFIPFIIIWILRSLFGKGLVKKITHLPQKISVPYLISLVVFVFAILIVNITILLYPVSTRVFFHTTWLDFLVICALSVAIASITIILSYFPIAQYFAKLEDQEYTISPAIEIKQLINEWTQKIKILQNKLPTGIMIGLLFVTTAIIPIDIATGLFIPSYHEEGESFSHSYYGVSDEIYLFIYSERINPNTIGSECRFYRLAQSQYTIYPAKLPLLSTIHIPSPTNITIGSTKSPAISAISSDSSTNNVGDIYVSINTSKSIDINFVPLTHNFTHIEFEFAKVSERFVANISYWKFLENVNISVTTLEPQYTDLGNGTWLETYIYLITNNEEVPLTTLALDFARFMYSVVNATTTKVYSQGQELITSFVYENRRLGIWSTIDSGLTLNLTITFQSNDIS